MKKTFKRIVAALLVAVMLFGSAPIQSITGIDIGGLFNVEAEAAEAIASPLFPLEKTKNLYVITYGGRVSYYEKGQEDYTDGHYGTDYRAIDISGDGASKGTTVRAVEDGKVVRVRASCGTVFIEHTKTLVLYDGSRMYSKWYSCYVHMQNIKVKTGDKVSRGTKIGEVGAVGASSAHLHFSLTTKIYNGNDAFTYAFSYKGCKDYSKLKEYSNYTLSPMWINDTYRSVKYRAYTNDIADASALKRITGGTENAPPSTASVVVTTSAESNITNNSATIGANLSQKVTLQEYGFVISTKKADVDVKLTDANNRKDTSTRDYVTNKSSETKNSVSMTVNKILGKDLSPNTTYYYKIFVKTNGSWFQSGVKSFKTKNIAPGTATLSIGDANKDIGIGDTATVSWSKSSNAKSYILKLYNNNNLVYTKDGITGTTYAFPASCFANAGTYEVKLSAKNEVSTVDMQGTVSLAVHDDVTVTFVDTVSGKTIDRQKVTFGHSATAPVNPSQTGYTFIKWDKAFNNLTVDTTVSTVYEANVYTVKFVDGVTGKVYKTEKVKYNTAATAPETTTLNIPTGYEFKCWDKDFSAIQGDTTVSTVYKWYNENYPVVVTLDSNNDGFADAVRNEAKSGYDVTVIVKGQSEKTVNGRLVIALKTESGYQYVETESAAFSITNGSTKTITVLVPSDILAHSVEVYTINDYETSGVLATPVTAKIDNSGAWSDWTAYTGSVPVIKGENGVTHVETKTNISPALYRYKLKETKTSYSTSMSGWTQDGFSEVKSGSGTINYVKTWPKGFDKSHSLYTTYNKTPKTEYNNATGKLIINSDGATGDYIYWHWCRGRVMSDGPYDSKISNGDWDNAAEKAEFKKFHAFKINRKVTGYADSAFLFEYKNKSVCSDSFYWIYKPIEIRKQTYTEYKKLYNYYRWTDWTAYSETDPRKTVLAGKVEGTDYQIEIIPGKTTYEYRFKTAELTASDITVPAEQIKNISGNVGTAFAGKEATVFVHKYTQPSDYTTEYVGKVTVGSDGSVIINNIKLREPLTTETGDFKVVASIEGNSGLIELQTFEAPKPEYTVTFYDYSEDGSATKVIYQQTVKQGETVTPPSYELLTIPEGHKFARWNQSTVNVNSDLRVLPEIEAKDYVVVFVDWGSQEVSLIEARYGEIIEPPTAAKVEGKDVSWDMSNATAFTETLADGTTETKYKVTQNTVITTKYTEKENEIVFIEPKPVPEDTEKVIDTIKKGEKPADDDVLKVTLPHGDHVDPPAEYENSPEYIFYGWKNIDTGELLGDTTVTDSAAYYPVYEFAYTVDTPYVDIKTGEYEEAQTVTLACDTENAVIWYTTDGSDPVTSKTAIEFSAPITINKSCVLKFYATCLGMNDSITVTELYAINNSAVNYYIYSVYTNLAIQEKAYYQALIRENAKFDDSALENFEGYVYGGIFYDEEYKDEYFIDDELAFESTTLYAKYTPKQYRVKFLNYDGTVLSEQKVDYATSATEPAVPERSGYVFVGWDTDEYQYVVADGTYTAKFVDESEYAKIKFKRKSTSRAAGNDVDLGAWVQITPAQLSDTPVSWSTSNPEIATVDHTGKVTLLKAGRVVITAIVDSTGESAECTINVTNDVDTTLVLGSNSYLKLDSSGYIREVKTGTNTVGEIKAEFGNYDSLTGSGFADTTIMLVDINGVELEDDELVGTGTIIKLIATSTGEELDNKVFIMTGDYDGDGEITNKDAARISRFTVDKEEPNLYQNLAMDVNGDGYVNNRDASMVSRYLVGKETI